ncbi:toxic anion resistance protein [Paenibacillus ihbetae]|uniref:KlaA protein n=1 Tax=Paenibacillus ihbetae TaxID=1870820 RepID=A0A1B2E5I9_9BACL|nr:toxic anion resistance protein [Paenibacillus ihbetae]ANY75226.1 KlaA protein [Paenibacillus ihbetae]OOC62598.1 toxic anion resistance protein [Paenibacillus ihbetae]
MTFTMTVPNENEIKTVLEEQVAPVDEEMKQLMTQAETNVKSLMDINLDSLEQRRGILTSIDSFGMSTMRQSSDKNSLLKVTVGKLSKAGDEGGPVAKGLTELHLHLKDLDPSGIDFLKTGFLGKLFNPVRAYFVKFKKADEVISEIVETLDKGKATLKNDNTTLEIEQQFLRDLTKQLQKEIQLGMFMDQRIEQELTLEQERGGDPEKIRFISEEVLFPLRQRLMDMQQMLAVNQQGYLAFEVLIRNNKELIRGVDRAKTVTVSALRVAVTVASALYNQKIVLEKIEALNKTTNTFIEGTAKMLKSQGVAIQKQAINSSVSVDVLKKAFADTFEAMEAISTFKQQALPKMRETIDQFRELADSGEEQIVRLERGKKIAG